MSFPKIATTDDRLNEMDPRPDTRTPPNELARFSQFWAIVNDERETIGQARVPFREVHDLWLETLRSIRNIVN